jgi:hypothetical protein
METVQIRCGSCNRVMAISVEDLGGQVHCPHCQTIVQAPPRRLPAASPRQNPDQGETESIFSGPEMDDIFDSGPMKPLVEMPTENAVAQAVAGTDPPNADPELAAEKPKEEQFRHGSRTEESAPAFETPPAPPWNQPAPADHDGDGGDAALAAMQTRRVVKRSVVAPLLLIILIPYALTATGVIAYLVYLHLNQTQSHPLEMLPDPKSAPKDGGPRRISHDTPLPKNLIVPLAQTLDIGALEVTPIKVQLNRLGELVLQMKMKNISKDQFFNPVSADYLKYSVKAANANKPYSYLDWSRKRIYGGFPEWLKGQAGKEEFADGDIGPGQEEWVRIITGKDYKEDVKNLAQSKETVVWRVQVRRGFVDVRGRNVSATAVIGVEFNSNEIQKET